MSAGYFFSPSPLAQTGDPKVVPFGRERVGERGAFDFDVDPGQELSPSCGGRVTSLLLVQKRSNQEKTTPRVAARRIKPGGSPAVLAGNGPPNNSRIHALKQFGYSPLPAPLLGGVEGAR